MCKKCRKTVAGRRVAGRLTAARKAMEALGIEPGPEPQRWTQGIPAERQPAVEAAGPEAVAAAEAYSSVMREAEIVHSNFVSLECRAHMRALERMRRRKQGGKDPNYGLCFHWAMTHCEACGKKHDWGAEACPSCGAVLVTETLPPPRKIYLEEGEAGREWAPEAELLGTI